MSALSHAWVDESMRTAQSSYIMAAVLAPPAVCDPIRDQFRSLRVGKERKTHWRSESRKVREHLCQAVARSEIRGIVVIGAPYQPRRQERARTQVLEHLLYHLQMSSVAEIVLEQRTESLNRRDMATVERLRGRRVLDLFTRVGWGQPGTEPMLWVADAVAGAFGNAIAGDPKWVRMMGERITRLDVPLR